MKLIKVIAVFLCTVFLQGVFADSPSAFDDLSKLLGSMHTMQATFEQSLINQDGSSIGVKTTGSMLLERPGKFRWEITSPNKQTIIVNKDKIILYDPDLSQLTKRKVDYKNGNPAILLSSSLDNLKHSFLIAKVNQGGNMTCFKLSPIKPKGQDSPYQWVKLYFDDNSLGRMVILDSLEQLTSISFKNIVFGTKISADRFLFTPPEGVDIFESDN